MTARVEVAIVGGGLVGASLAWGMRALGARLAVVDANDTRAASRGTFGLVWVQGKGLGMPAYVQWTLASSRAWPALAGELREHAGVDVALEQTGGLHACLSAGEMEARAAVLDRLFAQEGVERYDVRMLTREALLDRLPLLGPDVAGGSFSPLDGHCNPLRLLTALHAGLRKAGVVLLRRRVTAIEPGFRLHTADGELAAERVVVAAGRGTTALAAGLGVHVPLVESTGEVLVLERMRRFLPFALETIRQTDEGAVLLGDAHEPRSGDALDLGVLGAIARRAQRVFPVLAGARVVRAWAAARVLTPDGFPVYAESEAHRGAYAVACHSGVTLAAAHALELAPALLRGVLPSTL
ncbi:MAG TPA: FAD-dependent oxidoreductase, partial [Casimicrobiaceae bacterium]|nr:FAD-dependent oxidoreductase [Casimicrobiaceae bacterium]